MRESSQVVSMSMYSHPASTAASIISSASVAAVSGDLPSWETVRIVNRIRRGEWCWRSEICSTM